MNKEKFILREDVQDILKSSIPLIANNINEAFGEGFFTRLGLAAKEVAGGIGGSFLNRMQQAQTQDIERLRDIHKDYVYGAVSKKMGIPVKHIDTIINYYPDQKPPPLPSNAKLSTIQAHRDHMEKYDRRENLLKAVNHVINSNTTLKYLNNQNSSLLSKHTNQPQVDDVMSKLKEKRADLQSVLTSPDPSVNPFRAAEKARNARQVLKGWRRSKKNVDYKNLHPWLRGLVMGIETVI